MSSAFESRDERAGLDVLTMTHRLTRAYQNEGIYTPQEIENDVTSLATLHATNEQAAPIVETLLFALEDTQANFGFDEEAVGDAFLRGLAALQALVPFYPFSGTRIS